MRATTSSQAEARGGSQPVRISSPAVYGSRPPDRMTNTGYCMSFLGLRPLPWTMSRRTLPDRLFLIPDLQVVAIARADFSRRRFQRKHNAERLSRAPGQPTWRPAEQRAADRRRRSGTTPDVRPVAQRRTSGGDLIVIVFARSGLGFASTVERPIALIPPGPGPRCACAASEADRARSALPGGKAPRCPSWWAYPHPG